jgi:hypothetical protein
MRIRSCTRDVLIHAVCLIVGVMAATVSQRAAAQEWARKMFATTAHDFGVVPRGAKSEFEFKLTNSYKEDVHIASARSSCACTQPKILKADLKTYEEGAIIAELNTQAFVGARSAVVTVVIDRPFYAEVQLMVKGNIRSDILIEPGEVRFGDVDLGTTKSADVKVSYQGSTNRDWQVTDVRSANEHLAVRLEPVKEATGATSYTMSVRLKESAPAGDFNDEIQIVTNERQFNQVTLPVRASVLRPLTIAPQSIELGSLKPNTKATHRIVVKAKQPFEVSKVDCADERFTFAIPEGKKPVHIIPVEFNAGEMIGAFKRTITVVSTLDADATADVSVTGNVSQ